MTRRVGGTVLGLGRGRDRARRCWTWGRARATSPRPPRRSGRTPWAWTSRRRWSGGPRSPTLDPVPARLVRGDPGGGRGVRRGRRQLRVQPRRAAGASRSRSRGGSCGPGAGSRCPRGTPRAEPAARDHARRRRVGGRAAAARPAGRADQLPRRRGAARAVRARRVRAGRRVAPPVRGPGRRPRTSCGTGSSTRRCGSRRWSPSRRPRSRRGSATAFDRLVEVHRRADGSLAIPVAVQVTRGRRP